MLDAFNQDIDRTLRQLQAGQIELVRRNLDRLTEFDSSNERVQYLRCQLALADKDWKSLLALTRRALYFSPGDAELKSLRSLALDQLGMQHIKEQEADVEAAANAWNTQEQDFLPHEGAEILADAGALYIAMDPEYVREAAFSARSFKQQNPGLPCALITASECEEEAAFDHVIRVPRDFEFHYYFSDPKRMASIKVRYLRRSPFRKTLYLDSDTYVVKPLDAIFNRLDYVDFMYFEPPLTRYEQPDGGRAKGFFTYGLACPPLADSGVLAFRKSPRMEHFFDLWFLRYIGAQAGPNRALGNWAWEKGCNDQATLVKMISEDTFRDAAIRVGCLPGWQYNSKGFGLNFLKAHNLLDHVHLLHANGLQAQADALRADRLDKLVYRTGFATHTFPLAEEAPAA